MINVFRKRIDRLIHGDDGAALVVTLALFMMMYISCAGVFAIGKTVKEKMILQNAADAAAYSAAIVQADTLSRLATLNREMALTYKSMVCRQMDYVVCRWLQAASNAYTASGGISDLTGVSDHMTTMFLSSAPVNASDYGNRADEFKELIKGDSQLIGELNDAIRNLMDNYKDRVEGVVEDVMLANLPDSYSRDCYWSVDFKEPDEWMRALEGRDEAKFLKFVDKNPESEYGSSSSEWYPVEDDELRHHWGGVPLVCFWYCPYPKMHIVAFPYEFPEEMNVTAAKPYVLTKDFYDQGSGVRKGAISVGVAKCNRNPWEKLVKVGLDGEKRGLYEVFQPLIGAIDWTWAIASAQAGYIDSREFPGDGELDGLRANSYKVAHDYNADWEGDGDWNLRTDNWDAVYVPVCRSFAEDDFESWIKDDWKVLSPNPASDLPSYSPDAMTRALPQMHNSGIVDAQLVWSGLLGKIYH